MLHRERSLNYRSGVFVLQPHLKYGRFCRCFYVGLHTLVVLHDYTIDVSNVDLCTALQ